MAKIVLWIAVVFAVLFALRLLNSGKARRRAKSDARGRPPATAPMVRCLRCGVFLPQADASQAPGGYTCGDPACRQRHEGPR